MSIADIGSPQALATQLRFSAFRTPVLINQFLESIKNLSRQEQDNYYALAGLDRNQYPVSQSRPQPQPQPTPPANPTTIPPQQQQQARARTLTKEERRAEINRELDRIGRTLKLFDSPEIQAYRTSLLLELGQISEQETADRNANDPKFYQIGAPVLLKMGGSWLAKPREEFSVGEGEKPFMKRYTDPTLAVPHKILTVPPVAGRTQAYHFWLNIELKRDPEKAQGTAFGEYGEMFVHTGNTRSLFYSPKWIVDPASSLANTWYSHGAWMFMDRQGNTFKHLEYGKQYVLKNVDGEYMTRNGDNVSGSRNIGDAMDIELVRTNQPAKPVLPDKDFIGQLQGPINNKCANLGQDASLADAIACSTSGLGDGLPKYLLGEIPWWVYALVIAVGLATVKTLIRN